MVKKLILFPFGGNAREALDTISVINKAEKEWDVIGFVDDDPSTRGKDLLGVKVLGDREVLSKFSDASVLAVVGNPLNYLKREEIICGIKIEESRFARIIHPTAQVSHDAKIGFNTLIMANSIISCGVSIGNHCIILPNSVISHDTVVEDYCIVGSNVSVSGQVRIRKSCYIGSGTSIRDNIVIDDGTLVGIGANVVKNFEGGSVLIGNPAKRFKE